MRKLHKFQAAVLTAALAAGMSTMAYAQEAASEEASSAEEKVLPQRIVSMGPNMTEILFSIGAGDLLVGRTDYCDFPYEVMEIDSVGSIYNADIEKILSLEPDLVLASTHFSEEATAQLEAAGVDVLYLYDENDVTGVYGMIETVGAAVGHEEEAAQVVEDMQKKIAYVAQHLEAAELDPLSVYYVVGYGEYGDYTAGGDTFVNGILTAAGAENIAADTEGWSYSVEKLLEKDPDWVILPNYAVGDFGTAEPYSKLTAAAENRMYGIDNNMLDRQGPRNADAVLELAVLLYPEAFPADSEFPMTIDGLYDSQVTFEECPKYLHMEDYELAELFSHLYDLDLSAWEEEESLSLEELLAKEPDLILAVEAYDEETTAALKEAGIQVLYLDPSQDEEGSFESLRKIAQLFGYNLEADLYAFMQN